MTNKKLQFPIKMTHDELRDYIDNFDCAGMVNQPIVSALRAVVELHAAQFETFDDDEGGMIEGYWCKSCDDTEYPCVTIEAIKAALDA